ncbi:hypothetical protein BDZ88DRAFT_455004 [Geranomyces variabilis]|nr:hypothetical protein BDZ88DRAFT_455004 [Geranomyces variabilis]
MTAETDKHKLEELADSRAPTVSTVDVEFGGEDPFLEPLSLSVFLAALDQTVLVTATVAIGERFDAFNDIPWIGTAYFLISTALAPNYGILSDIFGRKIIYLLALAFFVVGSLICGVAPSMLVLIIGRAVAGIGAGGMVGLSFIIIAQRGKYQGIVGSMFGIASIVGPIAGGFFTDHLTWRWCFFINLPIGAIAIATVFLFQSPPAKGSLRENLARVDYLGMASIGCFVAGAVLLIVFVFIEKRIAKEPVVALDIMFQNRNVPLFVFVAFMAGAAFMSLIYYIPATRAGIDTIPMVMGFVLTSIASGQLISRYGIYTPFLYGGGAVLAVGAGLMSTLDADSSTGKHIGFLFIGGLGHGAVMTARTIGIQASVPTEHIAIVTALSSFGLSFGSVMGIAVVGSVMNNLLTSKLAEYAPGVPVELVTARPFEIYNLPAPLKEAVTRAVARNESRRRAAATKNGIALYTFSEVEALGAQDVANNARPLRLPNPESPLVICYTSGTTGTAKGVILTHRIEMSTSAAVDLIVGGEESCEVHISYLPLAHVFEKNMTTNMMGIGGAVGFYHGDTTALLEDMQILKPTIFPSVPRLLNRIYDQVLLQVSASPDGAKQFAQALAVKANHMKKTGSFEHPTLDDLVFNKIKQLLGGKVKHILSASAPLSKDVKAFCRIAFSAMVVELYGQTENNGALTISWPSDLDDVHVGGPVPCNEVKLVSVPEMGYLASRNEGEIWVRGPDVTPGYLNQPAKTRETITEDGWLKTGDIANIDQLGRFIIVDRKKNIFELSQGEYVAPEKVENIYARSPFIAQIYVHGDSHQSQLVALVVPDPEAIAAWAAKIDPTSATATKSYASWCSDNRLLRAIETDMLKMGRANNLSGIETVRAIRLLHEPFSAENGLMTPTFKLKRPDVAKAYRHTLDELYAGLKALGSERAKL